MNVEELRLGNIINLSGSIEKLNKKLLVYALEGGANSFEPIKTTEELLLKFGFKQSEENLEWMVKENITLTKNGNSVCFKHYLNWINLRTSCKYIHKLQNLYFDLKEKELKFQK